MLYIGTTKIKHFFEKKKQKNNSTNLVAHDCGYPLSRYTCRATRVAADFLDFIAFCRCSTGVALHPLKILVSHLSRPIPGTCRTEIWVWQGVALHGGVAATVAGVALHCATKSTKTLVFPCFLGLPEKRAELGRIIFRGRTNPRTEKKETGQKSRTRKTENTIFPLIFCRLQREELISGPGGGVFLIQVGRQICFWTLFFAGPFSKVESTQTILYYKNSGFGSF